TIDGAVAKIEKAMTGSVHPEVARAMAAVDATFPAADALWADRFQSWGEDQRYPAARGWLEEQGWQALLQKGTMLETMSDHLNTLYWYNSKTDDLDFAYDQQINNISPIYEGLRARTKVLYEVSEDL